MLALDRRRGSSGRMEARDGERPAFPAGSLPAGAGAAPGECLRDPDRVEATAGREDHAPRRPLGTPSVVPVGLAHARRLTDPAGPARNRPVEIGVDH
jgi:hypothetical protein